MERFFWLKTDHAIRGHLTCLFLSSQSRRPLSVSRTDHSFFFSVVTPLSLSTMAAPSTFSRLNFLPKPSLFTALTNFHRNKLPLKWPLPSSSRYNSSYNTVSATKLRNQTPKRDGDLIVLGIETSCDDTAAAVVSNYYNLCIYLLICDYLVCRFMGSVVLG